MFFRYDLLDEMLFIFFKLDEIFSLFSSIFPKLDEIAFSFIFIKEALILSL